MAFKSNAEQLNIEINLITQSVHQGMIKMSNETRDYATLVEQASTSIQSMMDKTGISANGVIAKIKELNTNLIKLRQANQAAGISNAGVPGAINPTLLNSALRDAENIRKGALSTISAEIQAENKLLDIEQKRTLQAEKQVDVMVEKVLQSRAEAAVDENDLAFERLKTAELERQLQLQTGMNAQQRAITAGRIPLADVDMRKAISENVMFDVNKFVGANGLTPQIDAVTSAISRIKAANPSVTFDEIGNSMKKAGVNANTITQGLNKLEPAAKRAGEGFNILRSAMGFLVAMGMSAIMQGLITIFTTAIQTVKDLEVAFYNLANAERAMSQAGTEVTMVELNKVIEDTGKKFKGMFSKTELTDAVADISIAVKDLGFGAAEIEKMLSAIAVVKLRTPSETMKDVTAHTVTALLSGRTQSLQAMGIAANEATVKEKALEMGLISSGEALTTNTKALAILQIMYDSTSGEVQNLGKYTDTLSGASQRAKAAWTDFLTILATNASPNMIQALNVISDWLVDTNTKMIANAESWTRWSGAVSAAFAFAGTYADYFFSGKKGAFQAAVQAAFDAMNEAKRLAAVSKEMNETPTGDKEGGENNQNLLDAQAEFNQAILDAELKLGQDLEEAKIDYERKLYDIDVEYKAKSLDLENDYANKVADINRSYSDKISEINQRQQEDKAKQRNDELQKEREFQNQMLVLKENFLMALDDALHARDARQILKLIKNYELDKAQAERKNALDKQSAKEDAELRQKSYNEDRKKAEADRKAKLAEAQRDYADKVAKLEADKKAEEEAARLANERKIEDLNRSMQDRLEVIAAGLVEEYKLTEDNLKGIVGLYLRYYNNATQILAAMRAQLAGTMGMMAQMQTMSMSGRSYTYPSPSSGGTGGSGSQNGIPMANGGTIIANKPTTVTFGERGLEAGTFMPLGRVGKDVNSLFSNVSGAGDGSGKVSIELLLSPDLESRIVSNTLSKTAEVFTRTQRSKR